MRVEIPSAGQLSSEAKKLIVEQIYYLDPSISDCSFVGTCILLRVDAAVDDKRLVAKILKVCDECVASFMRVDDRVLYSERGAILSDEDPHEILLRNRELINHADGLVIYQGALLHLIQQLDQRFRQIALSLGAMEQDYPTTIPIRSALDCGYLQSFPQHAVLTSSLHPDLEIVRRASKVSEGFDRDQQAIELGQMLGAPSHMLAPTVCYHCFESLRWQKVPEAGKIFTGKAKCHRHEYKTARGLERLQTFTMREIVFLGSGTFVERIRDEIVEEVKSFLSSLCLRYRLVNASDPFFAIDSSKKRVYQSFFGLKQEVQVFLPYCARWIAVGSFNNHRNSLVSRYGIVSDSTGNVEDLSSGCVGLGYERLALGVLAQFGCDQECWPVELCSLRL